MSLPPSAPTNAPPYSVSDLSNALKRTVETTFDHVRVRGEISGYKRHSSGHLYFALKDTDAVLDAVCWRGAAIKLGLAPEDGMDVIASGRLTTYPGRSKYQMVVERMELAGEGALLKMLEDRKRRLAAEGLFDPARKKKLPFLPQVIGVITSPTGAVIRDILHRLSDRFPRRVLLWPVAVQGDGAAAQVAVAIAGFNALPADGPIPRPDLLIVARGGGSLEDLWAFNEEIVVRAAAASVIPLISAVGHETDTTLIDYAADVRAPTPTGAAEMAVPVRRDLLAAVADRSARLTGAVLRGLEERRTRLDGLARALPDPCRRLEDLTRRLDDRAERLSNALPVLLSTRRAALDRLSGQLRSPRDMIALRHQALALQNARLTGALPLLLSARRALLDRLGGRLRSPQDILTRTRHALDLRSTRLDSALRHLRQQESVRLDQGRARLDSLSARLPLLATRLLDDRRRSLRQQAALLESFSYEQVLKRGFALVRDQNGEAITSAGQTSAGQALTLTFRDQQQVRVHVDSSDSAAPPPPAEPAPPAAAAPRPPRKPTRRKDDDRQGSLF